MSLQTIIKLLKWLSGKLIKEQEKLNSQSAAISLQIMRLNKTRTKTDANAATAGRMSKAVKVLLED